MLEFKNSSSLSFDTWLSFLVLYIGRTLYIINVAARCYVCFYSDRTYFAEGQKYPFGKLFISCSRCCKTTHQPKWRILENTHNLPRWLPCATEQLGDSPRECACSHAFVHASKSKPKQRRHLRPSRDQRVAQPWSVRPGWTQVYPPDVKTILCSRSGGSWRLSSATLRLSRLSSML